MKTCSLLACLLLLAPLVLAQSSPAAAARQPGHDISGMYSFLQEGEFLELDIDEQNQVSGYVSRYGDLASDRGAFLDHLFEKADLQGNRLHFVTKTIHGVWFEFKGNVERGTAKQASEDGYWVLRGTLYQYNSDEKKKTSAKSREVTLKSFPQDALSDRPAKD